MSNGSGGSRHPGECKTDEMHRALCQAIEEACPSARIFQAELFPAIAPAGPSNGQRALRALFRSSGRLFE